MFSEFSKLRLALKSLYLRLSLPSPHCPLENLVLYSRDMFLSNCAVRFLPCMQEYLNKYDILYQCKVLNELCGKCRSAERLKIWAVSLLTYHLTLNRGHD